MQTKSTTVITQATAQTENANYQIEYSISNGILNRVTVSIYIKDEDNNSDSYIGSITYDHENISCSISAQYTASDFFADFNGFLIEIKEAIEQK